MIPRQYRIHIVLIISAALMIILPIINERPDTDKAEAATVVATQFLGLIDADQYDASWQISAKLLQDKETLDKWHEQLIKIRETLGESVKREQSDISYATVAKDSPEGEYIQIFYDSQFSKNPKVEEIVTVMLEEDGLWRVAGYYVR